MFSPKTGGNQPNYEIGWKNYFIGQKAFIYNWAELLGWVITRRIEESEV